MEPSKVDMFIMSNSKYFESQTLMPIRERLIQVDDSRWAYLGIDRFMIGDTGLGIGKLLTCGGFGIWAIVDWFLIMGATREKNLAQLQPALA